MEPGHRVLKVSHGCKNCYAERDWSRLLHLPAYSGRAFTDVAMHPERLCQPLRWGRPRHIFVNSMSDLFHDDVPDMFIDQVFAVMAMAKSISFKCSRNARRGCDATFLRLIGKNLSDGQSIQSTKDSPGFRSARTAGRHIDGFLCQTSGSASASRIRSRRMSASRYCCRLLQRCDGSARSHC